LVCGKEEPKNWGSNHQLTAAALRRKVIVHQILVIVDTRQKLIIVLKPLFLLSVDAPDFTTTRNKHQKL